MSNEATPTEPLTDAMIKGWIYNGHDAEASAIAEMALYGEVDPKNRGAKATEGMTQQRAREVVAEMQTEARAMDDSKPFVRVVATSRE